MVDEPYKPDLECTLRFSPVSVSSEFFSVKCLIGDSAWIRKWACGVPPGLGVVSRACSVGSLGYTCQQLREQRLSAGLYAA
ncbi:hypothetical protein EVAR_2546_1 [Eumeta japonica]|uniref:Uncharacterized protein n=1 Tax=Eumeta variegata TaxID=151549 RepID=A0A4C1SP26_EUMVA|nr:hypothetical protein EVAR_2546_1 [Eumeta japonica]